MTASQCETKTGYFALLFAFGGVADSNCWYIDSRGCPNVDWGLSLLWTIVAAPGTGMQMWVSSRRLGINMAGMLATGGQFKQ